MTDYWKDRRPPAERLTDCERLLEAAQSEVERLHQCIRNAAESTDSFMQASEQLRAERDELLAQRTKLVSSLMQVASAVELEFGKDFDPKSRIGRALSRAGKLLDLGGCDD